MIIKNLPQKTILKETQLSGIGLHSGDQINIALKPAEENQGFVFIRTDLNPNISIPALANFVSKTDRGTTISKEGVRTQSGVGKSKCYFRRRNIINNRLHFT